MKKVSTILMTLVMLCVMLCGATTAAHAEETVKISIDEWIGWQSLLDANGGLKTAPDSINAKNGINVEYVVMNDATTSSAALISGDLQGAGYTVNRYAFLQAKFDEAGLKVVMPYITNFSNGGDGIIAKSDILTLKDLVGRKVAVPKFSEAQTLVEWLLNNSDLTADEKAQVRADMVYFETADDTAKAFFSGSVDAAATWEPYLTQAASSTDSRVLFDTSMSTNLILDGIVFRKDFVDSHEDFIVKLMDGSFEAASMYKHVFENVKQMPMFELMADDEIVDMANGADLATCAQNVKLLKETAVQMYADMAEVWIVVGETAYPAKAADAFDSKFAEKLLTKYPAAAETTADALTEEQKVTLIESPESLLSYTADIKFDLNSTTIKESSYAQLDEFVKVAKILDGVYIQLEGNAAKRADGVTDQMIIEFSEARAQSVKDYFVANGIDANRIVVVGNGDFKPLNEENLAAAENRRTEFYFKTIRGY
ncbi:MAG: OmpA family protein [Clostridia bacterium]|nr:OmpA family protein [Clostridia bacterium]